MGAGSAALGRDSTTITTERRERVAFAVPHYITCARLLVRADGPIAELRDLERKGLVSTTGTTPLKTITQLNRERLLGVNIGDVPNHARGIEMVEKGEADAFLMDEVLLIGLVATRRSTTCCGTSGSVSLANTVGLPRSAPARRH